MKVFSDLNTFILEKIQFAYKCVIPFLYSFITKEDNGDGKMMPGVHLNPPRISSSPRTQTGP